MKAYYCSNEPLSNSAIYITNFPELRKKLKEFGLNYQGWSLEDSIPVQENKAPTIRILSKTASLMPDTENLNEDLTKSSGASEEEINLVINYMKKNKYKLFDNYSQFIRLERFNKLPGRMLTFLMYALMLWILWLLLIK